MYRLIRSNIERVVNDEHVHDSLIKQGYKLIEDPENTNKNLSDLTVEGLKELAKEKGIEGISKMKKEELIEVLKGGE